METGYLKSIRIENEKKWETGMKLKIQSYDIHTLACINFEIPRIILKELEKRIN